MADEVKPDPAAQARALADEWETYYPAAYYHYRIDRAPVAETLRAAAAEVERLRAFKDWVHAYLDGHRVPHHPPGPHGAEGCRIGDRMDWLMAELARLRAEWDGAVAAEREACARLAEETKIVGALGIVLCRGEQIADAIRARGEAKPS